MKKVLTILAFSLFSFLLLEAQTIINTPTINKYANVVDVDYCKNTLDLPTGLASQFSIGEKVLIIQMKGASLKTGNNMNSGKIDDYNSAGNYEINEIKSINSGANDIITFRYQIERAYDISGAVQIVSVPQYADVVFQNTLTCFAWNGSIGGVLAFNATGSITLNANIDVSEKGFRGGIVEDFGGTGCFGAFGYTGYNCDYTIECGGAKGEGIGNRYETKELARSPNANGGGGGNDHNAGGAGGGGFGLGGLGGNYDGGCNGFGGLNGEALSYNNTDNKIFMTGAGGAGDSGNQSGITGGTSGGNSGGIVFITGNNIIANGNSIISNGESITNDANNDGAGGGGSAGLVLLAVDNYSDQLNITLNGGDGGSTFAGSTCPGPGGGGSGGIVWLKQNITNSNLNLTSNGGIPGIVLLNTCVGSNNGATSGEDGGFLYDFPSYESNELFEELSLVAGSDTTICGEGSAPLWANAAGSGNYDFQWNWSSGSETDLNFNFDPEFSGFYNVIASAEYFINGQICNEIFIVKVDIRKPNINITASSFFGDTVKPGEAVFVNAVVTPLNPDYIYEWTPADRVDPNNDPNAVATAAITEEVCLKVTDDFGCSNTECVDVFVFEPFIKTPNAFSPNGDGLNDDFIPIMSEDLEVVAFNIYDRWGDLVYSTSENIPWDGAIKGKDLPSDLYVWHLKAKQTLSGVIFERQGNISIVR